VTQTVSSVYPVPGAEAGFQLKGSRTWLFSIREANKAFFLKFTVKISLKSKKNVVNSFHGRGGEGGGGWGRAPAGPP
jgi:hypothetical protein